MAEHGRACPYDKANVLSKISFWWMNALFKLGFQNELTEDNICDVSEEDASCQLESKLKRYWKEEVQKHSEGGTASLFKAVLKAFKWQWILPGLMVLVFESTKLVQPFLIGELVKYLSDAEDAVSESVAYGIGAALGLSALLIVTINPIYFFTMQHVALRMKVAVGALIYRKAIDLLHFFWASPLSVIAVIYLLYREIGVVCFWGLLVIVAIVPLQTALSTLFGRLSFSFIASYKRKKKSTYGCKHSKKTFIYLWPTCSSPIHWPHPSVTDTNVRYGPRNMLRGMASNGEVSYSVTNLGSALSMLMAVYVYGEEAVKDTKQIALQNTTGGAEHLSMGRRCAAVLEAQGGTYNISQSLS
ncbi:cystic fibrosis transmembrane conductance regulator [Elysia marginata]|uniref:Cystic fibrosis transmembrane conductance regulator n=1 Tax=Elysia marginata TaxID=1093978 RepID=A0AAV4FEK5_9GAST|nr:cystic fibrosis transmembrane conductance regulator [Elysia marginata]